MTIFNVLVRTAMTMAIATAATSVASAQQDYPNRPIHVIVPFAAGSGADIVARQFINSYQKASGGHTFVIDNRPGNNGNLGVGIAKNARPDGYTVVLASSGNMVGARYFVKDVPFDAARDFVPVGSLVEGPYVLLVAASTPADTLDQLTGWLKSRPQNRFGYATQLMQLASQYYQSRGGFSATSVAYKTSSEGYLDLQSGLLEFYIGDATSGIPMAKSGKLKAIALTSTKRVGTMPDLKTMREYGYQDADFSSWWGMYAPAGTPQPIITKLYGWLKQAAADPELKNAFGITGAITLDDDGPSTLERLKREVTMWEPIVRDAGIKPQ